MNILEPELAAVASILIDITGVVTNPSGLARRDIMERINAQFDAELEYMFPLAEFEKRFRSCSR